MLPSQHEYKTISARSKYLLVHPENGQVDFKRTVASLSAEDIVAFANSQTGGAILIGVDEIKKGRREIGQIVGCDIDDKSQLSILQKANTCISPIHVDIITENLNTKPFLRVEIPSSNLKPHCTQGGVYKIRNGRKNDALVPPLMLQLHLDDQRDQFLKRFQEATHGLIDEFMKVKQEIIYEVQDLALSLGTIEECAEGAAGAAEEGASFADEASAKIEEVAETVEVLSSDLSDVQTDISLLLLGMLTPEKRKEAEVKQSLRFLVKNGMFMKNRKKFIADLMKLGPYTEKQILAWEKELRDN